MCDNSRFKACVEVISSTLSLKKQRNTLRFGTIRLKWKTGFSCFEVAQMQDLGARVSETYSFRSET